MLTSTLDNREITSAFAFGRLETALGEPKRDFYTGDQIINLIDAAEARIHYHYMVARSMTDPVIAQVERDTAAWLEKRLNMALSTIIED